MSVNNEPFIKACGDYSFRYSFITLNNKHIVQFLWEELLIIWLCFSLMSPVIFFYLIKLAKQSCDDWVSILVEHLSPSYCFTFFPLQLLSFAPMQLNPLIVLLGMWTLILLISTCLSLHLFPPSALPSSATDLCWTSTSASAGEDSTIRAEWRSMALKVGYKSLCDIKKTFFSELSDQNFEYFRSKLLGFMKKTKTLFFFSVDRHTFFLKFFLCLWMGVLGLERLWNLHLQSKDSSCSYCGSVYLLCFYSELQREPQVAWITDLLD